MSNSLSGKIFNFLTTSPLEHITVFSVFFQAMEEELLIKQDALRNIVNNAVNLATNTYSNNILAQNKLLMVSMQTYGGTLTLILQVSEVYIWKVELLTMCRPHRDGNFFDVTYEGIRSLRDIEISKTIESPISREEITKNMCELKYKLKGKSSQLAVEMRQLLEKVNIDNLTWQKPLVSQVISDDSNLVQDLTLTVCQSFMKLAQHMQATLSPTIQEKCKTFIKYFRIENIDEAAWTLNKQLIWNSLSFHKTNTWKEREEDLLQVTEEILDTLSNIWKNPAFEPQNAKSQSEGTYITDVIIPVIRSALKKLPIGKSAFISMAERQKSSRLICIDSKEENDKIKLWWEMNDGMVYVHKGCRPDKNEFGILGIQVAGEMMYLSVLIKDIDDIQHLYYLRSIIIPVQPTDAEILTHFVEAILVLRASSIHPEVEDLLNKAVGNYIKQKEHQKMKPITIAMTRFLEESGGKVTQLSDSVAFFKSIIPDMRKAIASAEKSIDIL
ncbi:hypothetical protein C1646_773404 [Rhizophagus diaphanus]|nr:hypothetical protein C1646_773404 [Rhizophagus diaphanus] [Rhizophagus sp. MUCL 43196]